MKQGILITAYKEISHLKKLLDFFDDDFYFYIHIDKKSRITKDEIEMIPNAKNVVFFSRQFNVNWGGLNYLNSMLLLSKEAIKNPDIEYFHTISGQDLPIKSCNKIKSLLVKNRGREYLENFEMPVKVRDWGRDGGMDRICYFNFYDLFNAKTISGKIAIHGLLKAQRILKIKRNIQQDLPKFFGGSIFWTLSYPCLKYVVDYTEKHPYFLQRLKYSFCSEEIYYQTIIMNSAFKENVVNNNLRYIEWNERNGNKPANLDETDYDKIIKSDAIFARKFEYPVSKKLMNKIEEHISYSEKLTVRSLKIPNQDQ
jgi:hypothetical protein